MRKPFSIYRKLLCIVAQVFVFFAASAATVGEESVVSLLITDGLAGETVNNVMTEHSGQTWIATNSGVNAYDGKKMYTFRMVGEQGRYLTVYDVCETTNRSIWAATEGGLYCMEYGEDHFKRVLPEVHQAICLLAVGDTVYIGGEQGFLYYDGHQLKHQDVDVSHRGLNNIVRQYVVGNDGLIWFLGRFELNSYDPRTGEICRHSLNLPLSNSILTQFAWVDKDRLVVGTRGNGLFDCDLRAGTATCIEGVGNIVSKVCRSSDGHICVATDGSGAYRLKMKDGKLSIEEHFHAEGDGSHRLPSNGTYCYYRDQNGVNWFGFVRYGLAYTYYSGDLFKVFSLPPSPSHEGEFPSFTTEGLNVRTCCRHGDDMILGMQNGFHYMNVQTGTHRFFSSENLGGGHIVNTVCWYEGYFYIGTFDGGLHTFDPQTLTLQKQTITPLLDGVSIGDLKAGPDGRLWIGSSHGLMIISDGKIDQHFTEQNSRIVGGLILSITFDGSGNAWLTGESGCSLYSVRSHEIVETTFPEGFFNKQTWMWGAQGHDGLVFLRTGPQTFYTNEQMTDFGELRLPVAFYDKWCRSFVDDMKGHYLIASERGVFCFSYDLKEMMHFGYGEGLRGDFINDMSFGDDSLLWVSTSQGLYYGNLNSLAQWKQNIPFKVRLYDIRKGSDLASISEEYVINDSHHIRLVWNLTSEVLQAEAVLPDYSKSTGRLYEYRVDGDKWIPVESGQTIDLRRLMLGKHRLEVRLAGVEASMSAYKITVVPSFWAVFELVLLVVSLLLLWLWWRWHKRTKVLLTERDEIEDALIESEELRVKSEEFAAALEEPTEKYQKVRIDEEECAAIVSRMKDYLERERVYTNADLKMKDLADVLHLSAPKLSQVFNLYIGQNYYDFINGYRLAEFKRLINAGEYKRYTITALSEQCGFKKSNFFSTFRKVEGMTPTEYLKKEGIKIS